MRLEHFQLPVRRRSGLDDAAAMLHFRQTAQSLGVVRNQRDDIVHQLRDRDRAVAADAREAAVDAVALRAPFVLDHDRVNIAAQGDGEGERVALLLGPVEVTEAPEHARAVVLIIKYDDFRQITRRTTLDAASSDGGVLARTAIDLLSKVAIEPRKGARVRLCGISATQLEARDAPRQLGFNEAGRARGERLGDTIDRLAEKFGKAAIRRAVHLKDGGEDS